MKNWIDANSCKREFILQYFEEPNTNKVYPCCDYCGLHISDYQETKNTITNAPVEEKWKDYLAKILLNSGLRE
jgi:ATP-dependent DNA helicase RecQ